MRQLPGTSGGASPRHRAKQEKRQARFLAAFVQCATVLHAAEQVHMPRAQHHAWMRDDPVYRELFAQAQEDARQVLEREAYRRAVKGILEPVFHQGKRVNYVRKYSDVLLIFLLKAMRPEVYRDRVEHTGKVGLKLEVDLSRYSDDQLETLERLVSLGLPGAS